MRIRVMERDPARLAAVAADWGVKAVPGQATEVTQIAIADAYLRDLEAETRRAMREAKR
jgi:hypothetical protein